MESTAQRTSRIASEDAGAHSAYAHAKDFFNGLATYSIEPSHNGFSVCEITPHGQLCTSAKTMEEAQAEIESWKNTDLKNGYPKRFFVEE
jgi:hypothetical protein